MDKLSPASCCLNHDSLLLKIKQQLSLGYIPRLKLRFCAHDPTPFPKLQAHRDFDRPIPCSDTKPTTRRSIIFTCSGGCFHAVIFAEIGTFWQNYMAESSCSQRFSPLWGCPPLQILRKFTKAPAPVRCKVLTEISTPYGTVRRAGTPSYL